MEKKKPVILFADENSFWSRSVRGELRRRGACVLSAPGEELLLDPQVPAPDVVVLRRGNESVAGRFRERWPRARLLAAPDPGEGRSREPDRDRLLAEILAALPEWRVESTRGKRNAPLVLCVDDDRFYLDALARILLRHGYRAATFEDPEKAIQALPEIRPDLAIVDVVMPGMDGLDLAEELREITRDRLPVILLTARSGDDDIARGYEHGASYYITKPCDPAKVLNIVDYFAGDLDPEERRLLETQL